MHIRLRPIFGWRRVQAGTNSGYGPRAVAECSAVTYDSQKLYISSSFVGTLINLPSAPHPKMVQKFMGLIKKRTLRRHPPTPMTKALKLRLGLKNRLKKKKKVSISAPT
jgi:hypothetical protein